jgi:hypothetical protein
MTSICPVALRGLVLVVALEQRGGSGDAGVSDRQIETADALQRPPAAAALDV